MNEDASGETCRWKQWDPLDYGSTWEASCEGGPTWCLTDGTPDENNVRFCHGCGKPVDVHPWVNNEETE